MTESIEARLTRLEDLMAIHQLFVDYGEHLDSGNFEAYSQLFADDGEVLLGPYGRAKGRSEIKALMDAQLAADVGKTFHVVGNPRVTITGDTATSTVMWSVAQMANDGLARVSMVGHHIDQLTRTAEGWRFQRRKGIVNLPAAVPR